MFHNVSNMWTIMGTKRILSEGNYGIFVLVVVIISTLAEILLPIFPRRWQFRRVVNMPIILAAPNGFPATIAANFNSWVIAGLVLPVLASRCISAWSPEWQYLFLIALAAGTGLASGIISPLLSRRVKMPDWWGSPLQDHWPLAQCPTSSVAGCRWTLHVYVNLLADYSIVFVTKSHAHGCSRETLEGCLISLACGVAVDF